MKKNFRESGVKPLTQVKGSLSNLILAHQDELDLLSKSRDKEALVDLVTVMMGETNSEAIISKIEKEVIPALRSKSFNAGLQYLYDIILKGDGMGMGRLRAGYRGRY